MNDKSIEEEIVERGLTAPRVTNDEITELCARLSHTYETHGTSTFCHGFLDGKFYVATGHSACVSPENFDVGIGRRIAFENMAKLAREKFWELEGYALYKNLKEKQNG